jgi:hypothetical protein
MTRGRTQAMGGRSAEAGRQSHEYSETKRGQMMISIL